MRTQGTCSQPGRLPSRIGGQDDLLVVDREITIDAPDFGHLKPMLDITLATLERHGVTETPHALLAEAGYWHNRQIQAIATVGSTG